VDPTLLVEKTVTSTAEKDRLRKYTRETSAAQAQASQGQEETMRKQIEETLAIERSKAQETARSNRSDETLTARKIGDKRAMDMLELWEKADDNEKAVVMERLKLETEHLKIREGRDSGQGRTSQ
jgi:hypothetical protein